MDCARTGVSNAPDPVACHGRPTPLPETPGHSQTSLTQSLVGSLNVAVHEWDLLKEVSIIFITSTIVWPQVNKEGTQPRPSTENWIKDLLSMALPIRTRPSFPHSQSLPSGSFHKPVILLQQMTDRMKTTITEN